LEEEYMHDVVEAPKAANVAYKNLFENAMKGAHQQTKVLWFKVHLGRRLQILILISQTLAWNHQQPHF
jgi:hypothetical protein